MIDRDYYIPSRHATLKSPRKNDSALTTPPTFMQHPRPIRESIRSSPGAKVTQRNPSQVEQLEQALREETIANEEQRNYI
jgi:hypothetical protein